MWTAWSNDGNILSVEPLEILKELLRELPTVKKTSFIIYLREKCSKQNIYHEVSHIVCFETFSVKRKENYLHRKYRHFLGPAENLSSPTISQIE